MSQPFEPRPSERPATRPGPGERPAEVEPSLPRRSRREEDPPPPPQPSNVQEGIKRD